MNYRSAPIQRKLMLIILATSCAVLVLTCSVFLAYENLTFKQDTVRRLSILATMTAENSTAALAFDNHSDAAEVLSALSADEHITAAALYDHTGTLFCTYPADRSANEFPMHTDTGAFSLKESHLSGFEPVVQGGQQIGTLYIQSDLRAMEERSQLYGLIVLIVFIVSILIAVWLSRMLQKGISQPILSLAETAQAIAVRHDYSVRASIVSHDELGLLTDAFNQMLTQIEEQNKGILDSEERFRLMVANVQDYAFIMLDPNGNISTWNLGAERVAGFQTNQILGKHYTYLDPESDEAEIESNGVPTTRLELVTERGFVKYSGWRTRADGSRYYADITLTALFDDTGHLRGFCKVIRDITERKVSEDKISLLNLELEQRVLDRTAALQAANKELEAFAYSVSHDLRSPLRTIDGFSQALLEDLGDTFDPTALSHLKRVRTAAQRMGQLIDDLLELSRHTRGEMIKQQVHLSALARTVCSDLSEKYFDREFTVEIQEGLEVEADQRLMRVVMENLLGNAWKYSSKKEHPRVTFGCNYQDGAPIYFVSDNGAGFDMKYSKKLFGAFQRLHSIDEFEGTGIGLATIQRIIHRHGGKVWAEGSVGEGATFYFSLGATELAFIPYQHDSELVS